MLFSFGSGKEKASESLGTQRGLEATLEVVYPV
jgi:hypothetical protein